MMTYATSWRRRPGRAASDSRRCCAISRPKPRASPGARAFARKARRSAVTLRPLPRRERSTRTGAPRAPMPAEPFALSAGQIVLADWRADALPKEPNRLRPAVVVEDDGL